MPTGEPAGSIPNVGLFAAAIKGKLIHQAMSGGGRRNPATIDRGVLLLEQLVGSAAMSGGGRHMRFDPGDFALERLDPYRQLVLGKGPQVLFYDLRQRVLRLAGKEVVLIHAWNR